MPRSSAPAAGSCIWLVTKERAHESRRAFDVEIRTLLEDGWTPQFSRAVYQANFVDDQDISSPDVLAPLIAEVGAGPEHVLAAAQSDPIKALLKDHVRMAKERGLFGAPSFLTADGELFWGNDRLEQALDWAVRHQSREHA